MSKVVHISRMGTLGGIERLLQAFVNVPDPDMRHSLFITGEKINQSLCPDDSEIPIKYSRYAHGIKLPKFLRSSYRNRELKNLNPDVISFWGYPTTDHDRMKFPANARLIYQEHGSAWDMKISDQKKDFLNRMDGITCCSFAAKRMLELRWNCSIPMTVIQNPIPPHVIPSASTSKKFPTNRPFILGTAGRLVPYKATILALFALKQLRDSGMDCRLRIAGDGDLRTALQQTASRLEISDYTEFLGRTTSMSAFYSSIDCFLLPSIREPFGLVAAEASAFGCPVIAAAVDGIPEAIPKNEYTLLIQPELTLSDFASLAGKKFIGKFPETIYNPKTDLLCAPQIISPEKIAKKIQHLIEKPDDYEAISRLACIHTKMVSFDTYFTQLKTVFINKP